MKTKNCKKCNEEFSSKDKKQKYCSRACYTKTLLKDGNPFYNKKHSPTTISKMKETLNGIFTGDKNPFFGKKHSEDTINIIKSKNLLFRENNKDLIQQRQLKRLNLTEEKINTIFNEYKNTYQTFATLQDKYNVDKRVLKKYFIEFNFCSNEELKLIAHNKKMKNATSVGEETLYLLLCETYGEQRIKRQYNISFYFYDFLIDDKLLIEYDGYYWHNLNNNNDVIKTDLAATHGYKLYRVCENEKRKVDFIKEINNIKDIYEIQT